MNIVNYKNKYIINWSVGDEKINFPKAFYAIGNFDGVHKGHKKLINHTISEAKKFSFPIGIITFNPHPRQYFRPYDPPFIINDNNEKLSLLSELNIDYIINICFNENLQKMSANDFINKVLIENLNVRHLFAGSDFAFGRDRSGRIDNMTDQISHNKIDFSSVQLLSDRNSINISSTRIRSALQSGQIQNARQMLGHDPFISGVVQRGDQRGRKINFPTANLIMKNRISPAFGVYAVKVIYIKNRKEKVSNGIANIGIRPTVNNRGILAEIYIFDFNENLYNKKIKVFLKTFLRPEKKFANLDELKAQITKDVKKAKTFFQ